MSDESLSYDSSKTAQATQQRLEFYFVALTFTLLGLAVQTAEAALQWIGVLEISGWAALLVSGLIGLRRLEWFPEVYRLHSLQFEQQERATGLRQAASQGARVVRVISEGRDRPIAQLISSADLSTQAVKDRIDEIGSDLTFKYNVQRGAFVVGVLLISIARAAALLSSPAA